MDITRKLAKSISYGSKRSKESIKYIVFHYTGNEKDTAEANATYFATSNTRTAGAHFFIDKKGKIFKSVDMNLTAWAVGGDQRSGMKGEAKYFKKCTNANSVSIEMCDCVKDTNYAEMVAARYLVRYIQKNCPNAKTIIRHWDVNGKKCPACMIGEDNKKWKDFKKFITGGYGFKAKVIKTAAIRSSAKVADDNKVSTAKVGEKYTIDSLKGMWGRIKGTKKYIALEKLTRIE